MWPICRASLKPVGQMEALVRQQGDGVFPGNGKQRGESAELRRVCQQLTQVTMERHVLREHSLSSRGPRSEISRHRGVGWSLSLSADVPTAAGITQRFLCLAAAASLAQRERWRAGA